MSHSAKFHLAGVMGWPVMHSRSPKLHNYWLAQHGLAGAYVPLAIRPERIEAALRALPALCFAGCNLTIPHKETALAVVDRVDARARRIGAISCVTVAADESLVGTNNDAFGFIASLREAEPRWRADAGPAVVVGAGGALARHSRRADRRRARAKSGWSIAPSSGRSGSNRISPDPCGPIAGGSAKPCSKARRPWSTRRARAWSASRRSIFRSAPCPARARRRYRLYSPRDAAAGRGAGARQPHRQRARHAAASGPPGLPCLVRHSAGGHARAAGADRGDIVGSGCKDS